MKGCCLDACSAILLARVGLLEGVARAYRVFMAPSAFGEVTDEPRPGAELLLGLKKGGAVVLRQPAAGTADENDPLMGRLEALGPGERDTVRLYLASPEVGFVVTDDGRAARLCRDRGIPFVNALLMTRLLVWGGEIAPDVGDASFAELLRIGRYSPKVEAFARSCGGQDLAAFLPGQRKQ